MGGRTAELWSASGTLWRGDDPDRPPSLEEIKTTREQIGLKLPFYPRTVSNSWEPTLLLCPDCLLFVGTCFLELQNFESVRGSACVYRTL